MRVRFGGERTTAEWRQAVAAGGVFVRFPYVVSPVVLSVRVESPVYFFRNPEDGAMMGVLYVLLSFAVGLWGVPWGPVLAWRAMKECLEGGVNVTDEVLLGDRSL